MGVNYSTGIVYGYDLGDLTDPDTYDTWAPAWMLDDDGESIGDWLPDDFLAGKLGGWTYQPLPRDAERGSPAYGAWARNLDRQREILKAADFGCSIDSYGHSEGDLTLLVKVDASEVSSDIWTAKRLEPVDGVGIGTHPPREWREKLDRFVDALELPHDRIGEPGWMLIGSVG